jgi:hypothetical protein
MSLRMVATLLALPALLVGCKGKESNGAAPVLTASTLPSASAAPRASASTAPSASASAPAAGPPTGPGVTTWRPLEETKECNTKARDLEPNLAFGGIGIAARGKEFGVAWHYVSGKKGEGLIAFSGYDGLTRTVAVAHGLGKGTPFAPQVFPRKDVWLVTWFDAQGLLYSKPTWAATQPSTERLNAITADEAGQTGLIATKGALLGAASLGPGKHEQIGLFVFAPEDEAADPVKAIGSTKHAVAPEHPAVTEVEGGWILAWDDELTAGSPRSVVVARLDAPGKELDYAAVSTPARTGTRPAIVTVEGGALVAWVEQDGSESVVVTRKLDARGRPSGPAYRIDRGAMPTLTAVKDGAVLGMLRPGGESAVAQVAATRITTTGAPAAHGVLVSELTKGKGAVAEPAGVAYSADEDRIAFVWTYVDGMRGQMKTSKTEACF